MPGTTSYHTPCEVTPIEWRRSAPGRWHRVRTTNDMPLCDRPMAAATQRRDLRAAPPVAARCQGCERFWPIFQWAVARVRSGG